MTEDEWIHCDDPGFLLDHIEGEASERKLRLFAVACCRRIWHLLTDERSRTVIEVTERYADGLASQQDLQKATDSSARVDEDVETDRPTPGMTAWMIGRYAGSEPFDAAYTCGNVSGVADRDRMTNDPDWWARHEKEGEEEASYQVSLLRDIFGNPFRPMTINPACQTTNVIAVAQAIYDERTFDRLPELVDALENAGCDWPAPQNLIHVL